MSTRSLIALADGDGFAEAVYVHSDGYPTYMGPTLFALARARGDDLARLHADIAAHHAWSMLDPDYEVTATPYLGERAVQIAGLGVACAAVGEDTEAMPLSSWRQSWHGGILNTDTEWAYVLSPDRGVVAVFAIGRTDRGAEGWEPFDSSPVLAGAARLADEPDWGAIECGPSYERCSHYAWYHFPEAEGTDTGTAEWLAANGKVTA